MKRENIELIFFGVVFILVSIVAFLLFKPFLTTLLLACTFSIVIYPLYKIILDLFKNKRSLASVFTIIISFVFILLPVAFIGERAFFEARDLYIRFATNDVKEFDIVVDIIEKSVRNFSPNFSLNVDKYAEFILGWLTSNFKDLVFGTISVLVNTILVLIAMFFFLRDGENFIEKLIDLSPMRDSYDREIADKVGLTVTSVIKGTVLIALIQGFLVGLGLFMFSVPNPFLWAAAASLCAFVPGLGTGLVIIPSVIYLFLTGNYPFAIGLSIWGMLLVGTIDNFLGPYLFRAKTKVHPLIMLFSVLGGLSFFGPEGFIFGPVIVSIFISFIHIYKNIVLGEKI